jgi:hypothetical protein
LRKYIKVKIDYPKKSLINKNISGMYKYRILILVLWGVLSSPSFGSSAFFSRDQTMLLAKNFDWKAGHGYVYKNKKKQK